MKMKSKTPLVLILGGSLTGLGVIRACHANKYVCVLLDSNDGIAFKSKIPQGKIIVRGEDFDNEVLRSIKILCEGVKPFLIATSDIWLDFIICNRKMLDRIGLNILHSGSSCVRKCLNKEEFYHWCIENKISTPLSVASKFQQVDLQQLKSLALPLIVRPIAHKRHKATVELPKAIEVNSYGEIDTVSKLYLTAGIEFMLSESLLQERIVQYSVPFACVNGKIISFVAIKKRPLASQCSVGSYVEIVSNAVVESFARDAINKIHYFGIGEAEILFSLDSGRMYLIEINARPWEQIALALASSYNFMKIIVEDQEIEECRNKKKKMCWISFNQDLFNCFSSSTGIVRRGELSFVEYFLSLGKANVFPVFSLVDLGPFLYTTKEMVLQIGIGLKKMMGR